MSKASALFREGDYVLVDLDYRSVGRRCLYFRDYMLTDSDVESVTLESVAAVTTEKAYPRFGPGTEYDGVVQQEQQEDGSVQTFRVNLKEGTPVNVFFETNGWVFAEFRCGLGTVRAWIQADQVAAE